MREILPLTINDKHRIEEFLYEEALCLDEARLSEWMDLYSEEGVYWMPASPDQTCPLTEISILYEDRLMMDIRRRNLGHELSPSMDYPIRSSRIIGNIRLPKEQPDSRFVRVLSTFHAQLYYREDTALFAGKYTHDLAIKGDSYLIVRKRVDLINADGVHRNLLIYI